VSAVPVGPVRPETLYQRNRQTPDRLNNSLRRAYDLLRATLQFGEVSQFLVESELTSALSASRNTVRAVLQQLTKDGLVTRSPKRGTYSLRQFRLNISDIGPFNEYGNPGERIQTELRTLEYHTVGSPKLVCARLDLPADWAVLMVESLLTLEGTPLGLTVSYIAVGSDVDRDMVMDEPDAILFIEKHLGVRIAGSSTTIGATAADAQSAKLLGVELGAPMISLEDVLEDETGRPWALNQTRLRSDRVVFAAEPQRKPVHGLSGAVSAAENVVD